MANGIEEILQMSQSCNLKKELIEELKKNIAEAGMNFSSREGAEYALRRMRYLMLALLEGALLSTNIAETLIRCGIGARY